MKRLTVFIFFISISVLLNQAYAQSQGCKFAGKVTDEHGQAIELASVSLNNSLVAFTNKDGLFEFLNVPAGRYDYRITFVGYETVSGNGGDKCPYATAQGADA
ncbi:MAG: carboxypeptidase-like regulatory domain-containing protein [Hoylesella buccalis]